LSIILDVWISSNEGIKQEIIPQPQLTGEAKGAFPDQKIEYLQGPGV
jgi:hypothetical protein